MMDYSIELMQDEDWRSVRDIYAEGIATGRATFETGAPEWEEWHQNHLPFCRLVARAGGQVIGWAALSAVSKRACYAGVAEVSIYISDGARRQGVGKALLAALIGCSEEAGIWTLQATIFAINHASRRLHLGCGFREVGYRERIARRDGVWLDTVVFERRSSKV